MTKQEQFSKQLNYQFYKNSNNDDLLRNVLSQLKIDIYLPESVKSYQTTYKLSSLFNLLCVVACISFISILVFGFLTISEIISHKNDIVVMSSFVLCCLSVVGACFCARDAHWMVYNLEKYRYAIPEHVLDTALRIKKQCQFAEFYVHSSVGYKKVFLSVSAHSNAKNKVLRSIVFNQPEYFIESWDVIWNEY